MKSWALQDYPGSPSHKPVTVVPEVPRMSFQKAFREEWERNNPQYQTRWLAFCAATGNDPEHWTGASFIIWIDKMLVKYGRPAYMLEPDHERFNDFLWQEAYAGTE